MFTGIIETLGVVERLEKEGTNIHIGIRSEISGELQIDQSVSHNGVCLTVVDIKDDTYTVTAVEETLLKSNLGLLQIGDLINLERAMILGTRLDGHLVQGHVDTTARCIKIEKREGSWMYWFAYEIANERVTVEKGSVTVDGVSLTVVDSELDNFSVTIIPYTFDNTRFKEYKPGTTVNIEFDVIGKYVARLLAMRQ